MPKAILLEKFSSLDNHDSVIGAQSVQDIDYVIQDKNYVMNLYSEDQSTSTNEHG